MSDVLELKAGRFYRTRSGKRVVCIGENVLATSCNTWFMADSYIHWIVHRSGKYFPDVNHESDLDIISEWYD